MMRLQMARTARRRIWTAAAAHRRVLGLLTVFGLAALSSKRSQDVLALTRAYTRIGEVLGIDWAQQQISAFTPSDQWERLLVAGLARDFEQLRDRERIIVAGQDLVERGPEPHHAAAQIQRRHFEGQDGVVG